MQCSQSNRAPPLSPFFLNDPPPTEIYTLSLHDALPIFQDDEIRIAEERLSEPDPLDHALGELPQGHDPADRARSEEHTSELQSHSDLVCRLLLEKKKR